MLHFRGIKKRLAKSLNFGAKVKRNTEGSSNELSLSVLDNLKSDADERMGEAQPRQRLYDFNIFTVHSSQKSAIFSGKKQGLSSGVAFGSKAPKNSCVTVHTDTQIPEASRHSHIRTSNVNISEPQALRNQEAKRRKGVRHTKRTLLLCICCIIALVGIGCGSYTYYRYHSIKVAHTQTIADLLQQLDTIDTDFLTIDSDISKNPDDISQERRDDVLSKIPKIKNSIEELQQELTELSPQYQSDDEQAVISQIHRALEARKSMLGDAHIILQAQTERATLLDLLQRVSKDAQNGISHMQEASAFIQSGVKEDIPRSEDATYYAQKDFDTALVTLQDIQHTYPTVDVSSFVLYINTRQQQNEYALTSDKAIALQDKKTADKANESYNKLDKEAREQAEQIPSPIGRIADEKYLADTESAVSSYSDQRHIAAESDAYLREYRKQN